MDDAYREGRKALGRGLDGFHQRHEAEDKARQPIKPSRFARTAVELSLPHEIRSVLGRRSSHPSDWVLIPAESALYNLRAGDRIRLFEKTRKGWVSRKEINGTRSGSELLAFQRRAPVQQTIYLGDTEQSQTGRLSYDAAVQQVFFQKDLSAYVDSYGYPSPELMLQRLNRPSLKTMSQTLDNVERIETPKHWICLNLCDADGQPAVGYAYHLRDSSGTERSGRLNEQGEAQVVNLADGPVAVRFGERLDESHIVLQRRAIEQGLDRVLEAERAEAASMKAEFQQKSLLGKLAALESARASGARQAAWGMLSGFKELSDLATQHINHALSAAWESWRYSEEGQYSEQFAQRFADVEFPELADVLGFDPRSLTREQWAETLSLANFIWNDAETRRLLIDFTQDYIEAQHFLEVTEIVSSLTTEFAFELAITLLTLGAGAAVVVATKARYLNKLKGLGGLFRQLAQSLKQLAGSKLGKGRTGEWHYQTLEKPASRGIEKGVTGKNTALDSFIDSTEARVDNSAPDKTQAVSNVADENEYITLYRGDRQGTTVLKSKASTAYGYRGAQEVIDNTDLDELFRLHKESSNDPPSPFISTSSDKRVAEFFAGENGVVNEFRIERNRAKFNRHNDFSVPAGSNGSLIPENEFLVPLYIRPSEYVK